MKIRVGFVSNSSSSSFAVLGITDKTIIYEIAKKEEIKQDSDEFRDNYFRGIWKGKKVDFYGDGLDMYVCGISIENLMETMNLPQMREYFAKFIKKNFGIAVPVEKIGFHYGEVYQFYY